MADTKKDTKKVKTDEKAAETIVDEVTAESADTAETTTTDGMLQKPWMSLKSRRKQQNRSRLQKRTDAAVRL